MSFPLIVFIVLTIIFAILLVLILLGVFKPTTMIGSEFQARIAQSISLQDGFCDTNGCDGEPIACTDQGQTSLCRGQCLLYQTFSTETNVVDGLNPIINVNDPNLPEEFKCLDGFIQPLQKRMATCQADQCVGRNGTRYSQGQTEMFYITCGDLKPCSGSFRSAVIFNFVEQGSSFNTNIARCLSADITTKDFLVIRCPVQIGLADEVFLDAAMMSCNLKISGVTIKGTIYQIRIPGTANCLGLDIGKTITILSKDCLTSQNGGFVWFFPDKPITLSDEFIVPQQLIYLVNSTCMQDGDTTDLSEQSGEELISLQVRDNKLAVESLIICNSEDTTCIQNRKTGVLSAASLNCLNNG